MRILIVEPGKRSRAADIPHTLKAMQGVVGGLIAAIYPWDDPVALVCDDEGLLKGYELNRQVSRDVIIAGTFFICGPVSYTHLPLDDPEARLTYKNTEGYADPTCFYALCNVLRAEKAKKRGDRPRQNRTRDAPKSYLTAGGNPSPHKPQKKRFNTQVIHYDCLLYTSRCV